MNPERLKQIEAIYHKALEISPDEQNSFLEKKCGDDKELRDEVESLLAVKTSSDDFLDNPPESLAAEMFSQKEKNPNLEGQKIRQYKIIDLLGIGGMGEVYRAEDTKLRRMVALKFLPPQFSAELDRKKRFKKEAQAISALNHPNIITIYEIEDSEEFNFIATEFIDGQTLGSRIAEGGLNWQDAVRIAVQVSGALESAHSVGIIHRDIKPANIMIRKDGIVKILDFGLAKLTAPTSLDALTREQTAPNRVMGTINYMSPEQALGKHIDNRSDIFSFGVVLYEMLTGKVPFAGKSDAAIYDATIHKDLPLVSELNDKIPAALASIVKRALEKDRTLRYQNFSDLRGDLKKTLRNPHSTGFDYAFTDRNVSPTDPNKITPKTGPNEALVSGPKWSTAWMLVPLVFLGLAAGVYWKYFYGQQNIQAEDFRSVKLDILTAHGLTKAAAISPDGKYIAYAKDVDGKESIWLRQTASVGDTEIVPAGKAKYDFLKFSPDGNFLYFVGTESVDQPTSLYRITTLGRNQVSVVSNVDSQITFSPDGKQIAFVRVKDEDQSIIVADESGKNDRILITRKFPKVYAEEISWSPDGKLISAPTLTRGAQWAGGIAVIDVQTGVETPIPLKAEKLLRISQVAWVDDGTGLIYLNYSADMGQRYQLRYASYPGGEVQNVTNDLSSYEDFSLTADGKTMVAVQREYSMGIWLTPENDFSSSVSIDSKTGADDGERGLSWTKDGKIVYVSSEGGAQNIWRMDADGSNPKPLTNDYEVGKILPTLSVGGDAITYLSVVKPSGLTFFQMDADGQNKRRVVKEADAAFSAASANEDWLVYTSSKEGKLRILKVPLKGGDPLQLTNIDSSTPVISNDGKWVAYFIREKGKPVKLGIISIDGGEPIKSFDVPDTTNIQAGIAWNKNDDAILFVNKLGTISNIWTQTLDGKTPKPMTNFKEFQIAAFALNPEGTRLAIARGSRNRDVVLIKNLRK